MEVRFPNGKVVRGLSLKERKKQDPTRDYGLYCDPKWNPNWPADIISWPDFGVPDDCEGAAKMIQDAYERARSGESVEVGCHGGLGRTGTVLACMAVLSGVPVEQVVAWVRENYRPYAVENSEQERWVIWFSEWSKVP